MQVDCVSPIVNATAASGANETVFEMSTGAGGVLDTTGLYGPLVCNATLTAANGEQLRYTQTNQENNLVTFIQSLVLGAGRTLNMPCMLLTHA